MATGSLSAHQAPGSPTNIAGRRRFHYIAGSLLHPSGKRIVMLAKKMPQSPPVSAKQEYAQNGSCEKSNSYNSHAASSK